MCEIALTHFSSPDLMRQWQGYLKWTHAVESFFRTYFTGFRLEPWDRLLEADRVRVAVPEGRQYSCRRFVGRGLGVSAAWLSRFSTSLCVPYSARLFVVTVA
jgi:hypothetical protein